MDRQWNTIQTGKENTIMELRAPGRALGGIEVNGQSQAMISRDFQLDFRCTPEELRDRCREAVASLIRDNQKRPGSVLRALGQRLPWWDPAGGAGRAS